MPTRQIASSVVDIREDNETVASGPSFSEIPFPLLRALHHHLVKKVRPMYRSGATFKEVLKQVMFFKIKQNLWENVPLEAAFNCAAAKLYKFFFLSYVS